MIIYRIALTKYSDTSGEGAKRYGGRWNLPGFSALYGSSSLSAALLERLTVDPELFASDRYLRYSTLEIECDEGSVLRIKDLPDGWDHIPFNKTSQEFGSRLLQKGTLCFAVPSVVDRTSLNFVVNPHAERFVQLKVRTYPLKLDHRIVRSPGS